MSSISGYPCNMKALLHHRSAEKVVGSNNSFLISLKKDTSYYWGFIDEIPTVLHKFMCLSFCLPGYALLAG